MMFSQGAISEFAFSTTRTYYPKEVSHELLACMHNIDTGKNYISPFFRTTFRLFFGFVKIDKRKKPAKPSISS